MSEPIKVGDLVVAVRGCPGCGFRLGMHFQVSRIRTPRAEKLGGFMCQVCGWLKVAPDEPCAEGYDANGALPIAWLKRIPPLEELEGEKRREEIEA